MRTHSWHHHALLDLVAQDRECDLISDFAAQLKVTVICEMLGVPPRDRTAVRIWSTALAASLDHLTSPEADLLQEGDDAATALTSYFRGLVQRRPVPRAQDLLSGLASATREGTRLSEDEVFGNVRARVLCRHETTVNLIGNGMLALLRHPDQFEQLRDGHASAEQAVEELLRFDSPAQRSSRVLLAHVELDREQVLRASETVVLLIGAANPDDARFMDSDRLDVARPNASRHLSFGAGIHYCLGAPLARAEARMAVTELVRRLPSLRLLK